MVGTRGLRETAAQQSEVATEEQPVGWDVPRGSRVQGCDSGDESPVFTEEARPRRHTLTK